MALDDVIAGALADARESGTIDAADDGDQAGDTSAEESTDDTEDTDDAASGDDDAAEDDAAATGDETETEEGAESESTDDEEEESEEDAEDDDAVAEVETDDDKLAKALGVDEKLKGKDRWKAKVPLSKVKNYLKTNGAASVLEKVAKVFKVDPSKVTVDSIERGLTKVVADLSDLQGRAANFDKLEPLMMSDKDEDNDRFLLAVAAVNPKFKRYLEGKGGGGGTKTALPKAEDDPMPEPDYEVKDADGKVLGMTYTVKQREKYDAWMRRDIKRELQAETDARFKPIDDATTKAQKAQADADALTQRVTDLLADAREWDGFTDNEEAIQEEFVALKAANPQMAMEKVMARAYQKVVVGKLKASKQKVREEVLAEGKKAPKSTAAPTGAAKKKAAPKDDKPSEGGDRLTNLIRQSVQKAKAAGTIK